MSVRRSHILVQYKKEALVDNISSDLVKSGGKVEGIKATEKMNDTRP